MTPHARSFALRAAAKVALAAAATGCEPPEPQHVTVQTMPSAANAGQPTVGATPVDPARSPLANACVVKNVADPSATELACCTDHVANDGDSSAAYTRYERAQTHADGAGTPATPETRACCAALFNASERPVQADPQATGKADFGARRWACCTAFIDDPTSPPMSFARCTPWGPPVPPAMDWA